MAFFAHGSIKPQAAGDESGDNGASYTNYFYALNQQGDVVKIFRPVAVTDANGNTTGYTEKTYATYTYDAWGKLTGILDSGGNNLINKQTTSTALANLNPLRYRGYYYDTETGFYYLQSRYYDPVNRRFINADTYASTDSSDAIACNMFAYCANNPIINADPSGEFLITTLILIGAGIIAGGVAVYTGYKAREAGCDWGDTLFYAIGSGLCTFATVYTLGTTAYGVYANYCAINAITPVTEVGSKSPETTLYPPNDGFLGTPETVTLPAGTTVERFGANTGRYVAPVGTPPEALSLPPEKLGLSPDFYKLVTPLEVQAGIAAPWFDQPGGGVQYFLPTSISNLIAAGKMISLPY